MSKATLRAETNAAVEAFLANGGTVTVCKPQKRKARMTANGTQQIAHSWSAPRNRPSQNWDIIQMDKK